MLVLLLNHEDLMLFIVFHDTELNLFEFYEQFIEVSFWHLHYFTSF